VHLPFYLCDSAFEALRNMAIELRFYPLDESLSPRLTPQGVAPDELYLVVNYFGLMGRRVDAIAAESGQRGVIDDCQAFFHRAPGCGWFYNSARKFFGVPDGAYLDGPGLGALPALPPARPGLAHLFLRHAGEQERERAFAEYRRHEDGLDSEPRSMSRVSARLMSRIDYAAVAVARRRNFQVLDELLGHRNALPLRLGGDDVPYCYPFLASRPLREALISREVFVPSLWGEVATRSGRDFTWERQLAKSLCSLPVDQRYDAVAMSSVATRLLEVLDG
jgi:hypothetical protein